MTTLLVAPGELIGQLKNEDGITFRPFKGLGEKPEELRPLVVRYIKLFEKLQTCARVQAWPTYAKNRRIVVRKSLQQYVDQLHSEGVRFSEETKDIFREVDVLFPGDEPLEGAIPQKARDTVLYYIDVVLYTLEQLNASLVAMIVMFSEAEYYFDSKPEVTVSLLEDFLKVFTYQPAKELLIEAKEWAADKAHSRLMRIILNKGYACISRGQYGAAVRHALYGRIKLNGDDSRKGFFDKLLQDAHAALNKWKKDTFGMCPVHPTHIKKEKEPKQELSAAA